MNWFRGNGGLRKAPMARERRELNFDFYDDWDEEEEKEEEKPSGRVLGSWGNDELDRLLAGSKPNIGPSDGRRASHVGAATTMAGIVAGSVAGWSPVSPDRESSKLPLSKPGEGRAAESDTSSSDGVRHDIRHGIRHAMNPKSPRSEEAQISRSLISEASGESDSESGSVDRTPSCDINGEINSLIDAPATDFEGEQRGKARQSSKEEGVKEIETIRSTRVKKRVTVPFILCGEVIFATADSGAEDNIIARHLVESLGLSIESEPTNQKEFRVGNGNVVKSLGSTTICCQFANEPSVAISCMFYVWDCLITPMIMGMEFLHSTQAFTQNKHRLETIPFPVDGFFQVMAINNPRRRLRCHLDSYWCIMPAEQAFKANADTGSQVDLISLALCVDREFDILPVTPDESVVIFADGTIGNIFGKVHLVLKLGSMHSRNIYRTFYVLKDLTCDILIGDEVLFENDVFQTYQASISEEEVDELSEVNTIVWLNTPERFLSGSSGKAETALPDPIAGENIPQQPISKRIRSLFRGKKATLAPIDQAPSLQKRVEEQDARENHRRERISQYIAKLSGETKLLAMEAEEAAVQKYETNKSQLLEAQKQAEAATYP